MRIHNNTIRLALLVLNMPIAIFAFASSANAQIDAKDLANGDMETLNSEGMPEEWGLYSRNKVELGDAGVSYEVDTARPASGKNCLLIDARELKISSVGAWQYFVANKYAGKRVRVRAAIRLDALDDEKEETNEEDDEDVGFASLTIRAYRTDASGFFRPVAYELAHKSSSRNDSWKRSFIVIDVPKIAEVVEVGIEVHGKTRAWFDDISLEVVDEDVELTTPAAFDHPQAFFSWWMIFPVIAITLFIIGFCGSGSLQRFALRFSVSYWVIYFIEWWIGLVRFTEIDFSDFFQAKAGIVSWFTWSLFQTDVYPYSSGGSGDGIFNYAELLSIFVYSVGVAIVWSFLDWRRANNVWLKDLLRSFLRYSVAIVLLVYGLGKVYPEFTQFPAPSFDRMQFTYGESSPMGLLWTFMGASQPYTIFAGLGEVVAALLLIWRRTTLVGAFVAIGVMTNVVMLNFCYDVPVKLFSTHLLLASFVVLLPDVSRISKMFFTHGSIEKAELRPPYVSQRLSWFHCILKTGLVGLAVLFPAYQTISSWSSSKAPAFFGDYAVEEYDSPVQEQPVSDGVGGSEPATSKVSEMKKFNFFRLPYQMEEDQEQNYTDLILIAADTGSTTATVQLDTQRMEMKIIDFQGKQRNLPGSIKIKIIDEDQLELSGQMNEGPWRVKLRRRKGEFLLNSRGFRWVNPRPFNR